MADCQAASKVAKLNKLWLLGGKMDCLRCKSPMKELSVNNAEVDVCTTGCGALWFDAHELPKLDEHHEVPDEFATLLKNLPSNENIDVEAQLHCPRCVEQPTFRHFWSVKRKIAIDECPKCAGIWVDSGELTHMHELFPTEEGRKKAAEALFDDVFKEGLEQHAMKSDKTLDRTVNVLKYISPSYLIKQLKTD